MNQQYNQRVQSLFEAAVELPQDERAAFVHSQCRGNAELEKRVRMLLAASERPSSPFLRPLAVSVAPMNDHTFSSALLPSDLADDEDTVPPTKSGPVNAQPDTASLPDAYRAHHGALPPEAPSAASSTVELAVESAAESAAEVADQSGAVGGKFGDNANAPARLAPGERIHGQYEIIRHIGHGGMGTVYLARDLKLGRRVAMKFVRSAQPSVAERFVAEAQHTARCVHENIVVIHDVGQYRDHPFMVLEYLRGQTLSQLMGKGTVSPTRAIHLMLPVVRALACAHQHRTIHRDLKPSNVFITESGTVKVLDFGIAKSLMRPKPLPGTPVTEASAAPLPTFTRYGAVIGTPPYMSPEQWLGGEIDVRSDLWAVGIILYQLLVGKHPLHPLRGKQLFVTSILEQPMPSGHDAPIDIPNALADVIDACLKKHTSERIASADALLQALTHCLPGPQGGQYDEDSSPYAGLAAFQEADAARFFGRSLDTASVFARMQEYPLIGIVGPSGVGKSSFVRAGVIPMLKNSGEDWESFVIRPGRKPMATLTRLIATLLGDDSDEETWHAEDLRRHHDLCFRLSNEPGYLGALLRDRARKHKRKIVLFIDQFEELYTLTPDVKERLAFSSAITSVADDVSSPLRVLLSVRSDFLDRVAEDRAFMTELHRGLYFLVQPDRHGLREAIVKPAELSGYRFEAPWLVDQMLDQLEDATGALPLLQFAATKLWEQRNPAEHLLTVRSYRELGGVEGALATHANAVLTGLEPQEQNLVRAMFLHLVTPERTRAITPMSELRQLWHEAEVVQRVVDILVDARLLVTNTGDQVSAKVANGRNNTNNDNGGDGDGDGDGDDGGALVEIVHESLLHSWPMLNHWLDEHQEDAPFIEQLSAAARQWHERGRPVGLLWRGEAATDAATWSQRYRGLLPRVQREFLEQVRVLAARTAKRKRMLVAGTMAFLVLLVVAAGIALVQISQAEQNALAQKARAEQAYQDLIAETKAKERAEEQAKQFANQVDEKQAEVTQSEAKLAEANQELEAKNVELTDSLAQANAAKQQAEALSIQAKEAQKAAEEARDKAQRAETKLAEALAEERQELQETKRKVRELEARVGAIIAVDPEQ